MSRGRLAPIKNLFGWTNHPAEQVRAQVFSNLQKNTQSSPAVLYGRGYNTDDFQSVLLEKQFMNIRQTQLLKIRLYPQAKHKTGWRKTMFSSLPWFYRGAVGIKPNDNDLASQIDGGKHRVGGVTPVINQKTLRQFKSFCADWFKKNLVPLSPYTDVSVETWLKESPYDLKRKEELQEIYDKYSDALNNPYHPDYKKLESFIKDEFYMEPKTFRTINSRVEFFKCLVGPTIHAVEKEVFKLPYFIKKIPVDQRAQYIIDHLEIPGNYYSGSDAANWEGSVCKQIMEAVEIPFFAHMTKALPTHNSFIKLYRQLTLVNHLCFSGWSCDIQSRRMSGEMSTSIANGIINLMLHLFTAFKQKQVWRGVIEGDDALASTAKPIDPKYFKKLGFNYIMESHDGLNEASFCGLIFSDFKHTIRDPIKAILKLGWCTQQYTNSGIKVRMQLLRAKALSMKCEQPNCPILGPLADRLIELTDGVSVRKSIQLYVKNLGLYHRGEFLDIISNYKQKWRSPSDVTAESRVLMEKLFRIDVNSQLEIEKSFRTMELGPYEHPVLDVFMPRDNKMYWNYYIRNTPVSQVPDVMINPRISYYSTYLPLNPASDSRRVIPLFAIGVGT